MVEKGRTYKTKSGHEAHVLSVDYSYTYPFFAEVRNSENKLIRVASYNAGGMYVNGRQSDFDLLINKS